MPRPYYRRCTPRVRSAKINASGSFGQNDRPWAIAPFCNTSSLLCRFLDSSLANSRAQHLIDSDAYLLENINCKAAFQKIQIASFRIKAGLGRCWSINRIPNRQHGREVTAWCTPPSQSLEDERFRADSVGPMLPGHPLSENETICAQLRYSG